MEPSTEIPAAEILAFCDRLERALARLVAEAATATTGTGGLDLLELERRAIREALPDERFVELLPAGTYLVPTIFQRLVPTAREDTLVECPLHDGRVSVLFGCQACPWRGPRPGTCRFPVAMLLAGAYDRGGGNRAPPPRTPTLRVLRGDRG